MKISFLFNKIVDSLFNLAYSPEKKYERYLLILLTIGFILRLIAALNLSVLADDMVFASSSAGIIQSGIISTNSNPPLYFYLSDLAFNVLGYTTLASRLFPLLCGTMLIIVVFLLARELFNEKVALLAAFFATFANFMIKMTFSEQSLLIFFFVFLGSYLGLRYLKTGRLMWIIFSGVSFGLGILTKYNAPFFIFSFLLFAAFFFHDKKEKIFTKTRIKHLCVFLLIIALFALPFLAFNYILYTQKGILDVYFSRVIQLDSTQQLYSGFAGQETSYFQNLLNLSFYQNVFLLYNTDVLLFIFGLVGFILLYKNKERVPIAFLLIFLIVPFIAQTGGSPLQKHFVFMYVIFSIVAGYSLYNLFTTKQFSRKNIRISLLIILSCLMILNLGHFYGTPTGYFVKSETSQLKSFVNNQVSDKSLLLFDSRIYTAKDFWLATDKPFLTFSQFDQFYEYTINQSLSVSPTEVYVIECAEDDCGWGWVAANSDFNNSAERAVENFKKYGKEVAVMYMSKPVSVSTNIFSNELLGEQQKYPAYKVYKVTMNLNPDLINQTKYIQNFYLTPYLYLNMNDYLYKYEKTGFSGFLDGASLLIIYLAMILAIIFIISVIFFL